MRSTACKQAQAESKAKMYRKTASKQTSLIALLHRHTWGRYQHRQYANLDLHKLIFVFYQVFKTMPANLCAGVCIGGMLNWMHLYNVLHLLWSAKQMRICSARVCQCFVDELRPWVHGRRGKTLMLSSRPLCVRFLPHWGPSAGGLHPVCMLCMEQHGLSIGRQAAVGNRRNEYIYIYTYKVRIIW